MEGGGAERQLTYLCSGLVRLGWDVHVAMLRPGANFDRLCQTGAQVHLLPHAWNYDPLLLWRLVFLIRRIRPSLVQTWIPMIDILGGTAAMLSRTPWLLSERSSAMVYPANTKNRLRVRVAASARAIVANSPMGVEYWQKSRPRGNCGVIPNALDLEEIDRVVPADLRMAALAVDRPVVLYAGRFAREKNLDHLLDALIQIMARRDVVAALCGVGPLRPAIQERISQHGLSDRIFLPGYRTDLWSWMKSAAVFVSLSCVEGMPNTVMEAMACGCPLVVSDIPQHRALVNESAAWLVAPNDSLSIAAAIEDALTDRAAAARRAAVARSLAERWSVQLAAQQYHDLYLRILREG